eukprot:gene542-1196_t
MAVAVSMFRWLDLLEKEFDKAFVDLDLLLGEVDADQAEITFDGRQKMTALSSSFAQLAHKAQTVFQANAKLEAELVALRSDKVEANAKVEVLEKELKNTLLQLHAVQLQLHSSTGIDSESDNIKMKLESELTQFRKDAIKEAKLEAECTQFRKENDEFRNYVLQLQGEVYGARLAAKYLDKELAGRIQQIQLLGRDMKGPEHDLLWNQIEAEIHLHRHKTVIRACRSKNRPSQPTPVAAPPAKVHDNDDAATVSRKKRGIGDIRIVEIHREKSQGFGISITGGKEHGVPILISEIHEGMPAHECHDLYIGDAILSVNSKDLRDATHAEAVDVLSRVYGDIKMEVLYVDVDLSDEEDEWQHDDTQRYSMLGLVDDPSQLVTNGDVIVTNSPGQTLAREPHAIRHGINDVLSVNAKIGHATPHVGEDGGDVTLPKTNETSELRPSSSTPTSPSGHHRQQQQQYSNTNNATESSSGNPAIQYLNAARAKSPARYVKT